MRCAWQAYLMLLPFWMRNDVDRLGSDTLQELRLRIGYKPEMKCISGPQYLDQSVTADDLIYCVNAASKYSPWAAKTISQGFITASGGHRLGICGCSTVLDGKLTGFSRITSICIRVARDFPGIANKLASMNGSVLIIGQPGGGKTTLLRDLIRVKSDKEEGSIGVVDERMELFPLWQDKLCFHAGKHADVMSGCPKSQAIDSLIRCMSPGVIAVDEITASNDCDALLRAGWCGVTLYATAHARNKQDLYNRSVYKPLVEKELFDNLITLRPDKSWYVERIHT